MYEIWKILGENSSQIQIILAIIAIFFAIKASYYVKHQIEISQSQRMFELKIKIINIARKYLEMILDARHKNDLFKKKYYFHHGFNGSELLVDGKTQDESFSEIVQPLKESEYLINKFIKNLSEEHTSLEIKDLEFYLARINNVIAADVISVKLAVQQGLDNLDIHIASKSYD